MTTATQAQPLAVPGWSIPLTGGVVTGIQQLDQLHEPTLDGAADENARANCVFTCNAMLSRYFRPDLNADGDAIKDSSPSYGQGYTGFASQDTLIRDGTLGKWGTRSWRINGHDRAELLAMVITLANQGIPSIVTIPSMWGSQPSQPGYNPDNPDFYTHACVFAGTLPDGTCVLVNPWGGFLMYYSQADLALRLCYLCAYPVVKATAGGGNVANTQGLGQGFAAYANAHNADVAIPEQFEQGFSWATLKNGAILRYDPQSGVQDNRGADVLAYAQQRRHDAEARATGLTQQVSQLEAQITQLQKQPPAPASDPLKDKALALMQDLKSYLASL